MPANIFASMSESVIVILFKCRWIFNQGNIKNKIGGGVASHEQPGPIFFRHRLLSLIAVVVDFICVNFIPFVEVLPNGCAIIGFNHGF